MLTLDINDGRIKRYTTEIINVKIGELSYEEFVSPITNWFVNTLGYPTNTKWETIINREDKSKQKSVFRQLSLILIISILFTSLPKIEVDARKNKRKV